MSAVTFTMAVVMGLTGSLHCAGMCGPIVWVMPFQKMSGLKKWLSIGLYHFGRITVYALLGLLLHSFRSVFNPQWQQYISIVLGALLLVAGIVSFVPQRHIQLKLPWTEAIKHQLGRFVAKAGPGTLLIAGMLNGMLPCGLVYMALSMSVAAPSALQSVVLMYTFGAGTVPALVALTVLRKKLTMLRTGSFRRLVPVVMFVFGCLFLLRGMNLGVPYLSPKVSMEHQTIKSSCCHKH